MIALAKPISRKTRFRYEVLYTRKPREIVVTLAPGDVLEFRELGRRGRYVLSIEDAFAIAVRQRAARAAAERKKRKGLLTKAGLRIARGGA